MSTRADSYTQLTGKVEQFSDFLVNFDSHPMTGSLGKITNEASVRRSIMNLISTNLGERPFQPFVGSTVNKALFEPLDQIAASSIKESIVKTISYNEPRANLLDVTVYPATDNNSFIVNVVFSLINTNTPVSINVVLRRVR